MVEREAAGGVVYRKARRAEGPPGGDAGAGGYRFLMILDAYGHWCLPKGGIEPGETPVAAALREIREETGIVGSVQDALPPVRYQFFDRGQEVRKTVHYFLVRALNDNLRIQREEIRDAAWLSFDEALARCSYENLRPTLEAAGERLGLKAPRDGETVGETVPGAQGDGSGGSETAGETGGRDGQEGQE